MKFGEWIRKTQANQSELARSLGVTRAAVHNWVHGKVSPTVYYALAIEAVTGGEVGLSSWLDARDALAIDGLKKKVDAVPPQE